MVLPTDRMCLPISFWLLPHRHASLVILGPVKLLINLTYHSGTTRTQEVKARHIADIHYTGQNQ